MSGKIHNVQNAQADEKYLYLVVDGQSYRIQWDNCSPTLAHADVAQRSRMVISPSGYGIHWPEIDEDLALTPLLQMAEKLLAETA